MLYNNTVQLILRGLYSHLNDVPDQVKCRPIFLSNLVDKSISWTIIFVRIKTLKHKGRGNCYASKMSFEHPIKIEANEELYRTP